MPTTTRGAAPYPDQDENNDVVVHLQALADWAAANAALFSQSVLASRPSATWNGRLHWATDTKTLSYADGSQWTDIPGIRSGTLVAPVDANGNGYQVLNMPISRFISAFPTPADPSGGTYTKMPIVTARAKDANSIYLVLLGGAPSISFGINVRYTGPSVTF